MEFLDARRLTGPNVVGPEPGSILDVRCKSAETDLVIARWGAHVVRMLDALGAGERERRVRHLAGGVSLVLAAPIDALYTAAAINEWACACCAADLDGGAMPDFDAAFAAVAAAARAEANPGLLAIEAEARRRGAPFLWDDDAVSLGHGPSARTWPARELPEVAALDWDAFAAIPVGLVTGTNGKTTTARLARHIVKAAGRSAGLTSTDFIAAGDTIVDRGDWSGPGGARTVLRRNDVEVAILEAARGGLLRRGLGVEHADAALITNVAEDHLGDFGSQTLDELLEIKWVVSRAVESCGCLVLNADDPLLVSKAREFSGEIAWFSLDSEHPVVARHVAAGGLAFVLHGDELLRVAGPQRTAICAGGEIPIALGGAARHNVANALAAAALCDRLGIAVDDIAQGLTSMSQAENPGRGNLYELPNCRVLVDFAHNPHAMQALLDMARELPAKRRLLAFSQAGDRTDAQIEELARRAWSIGLDRVIVSELEAYRRGRAPGEVYAVIRRALLDCGAHAGQLDHFDEETESLEAALEWAEPGDLVIMLALGDSAGVRARLADRLRT